VAVATAAAARRVVEPVMTQSFQTMLSEVLEASTDAIYWVSVVPNLGALSRAFPLLASNHALSVAEINELVGRSSSIAISSVGCQLVAVNFVPDLTMYGCWNPNRS